MRTAIRRAMLIALLAGIAPPARAQDVEKEKTEAKEHYLKGTKHFNLGHFDDAIKEYELAYEAKDDPVLLYNIAQAHRLAGHHEKAYFYYRSYLQAAPKSPIRDEVNAKIEELRKVIAQESKLQNMPPTAPLPPKGAHPAAESTPPAETTKPPPAETPKPPPPKVAAVTPKPAPKPPVETAEPKPFENKPAEAKPESAPPPLAPPPPELAPAPAPETTTPAAATLTAQPPEKKKPIYKKWWFWTAIGGAVVVGVAVGVTVGLTRNTNIVSDCRFGVGHINCAAMR